MVIETDLIVISPPAAELESPEVILSAKVSAVVADCMTIRVTDESTSVIANDGLTRVRTLLKRIEEQRKTHLQPLNNYVRGINAKFDMLRQPIRDAENYLLQQIIKHREIINAAARREQERQNRLAEKRAYRAEIKGIERPIPEVVAPIVVGAPKTVETDAGTVSFRTDWKAEIVDASLLPREYLIPDETKIGAVVRAGKGSIAIPGVRIYSIEVPLTHMRK